MSEGNFELHTCITTSVVLICLLVQGYISSPVSHPIHTGQQCVHIKTVERYSPSVESNVPNDEEERKRYCLVHEDDDYYMTDLYGCDAFYINSVKRECLLCGLPSNETRGRSICPGNGMKKDDPDRQLTCGYCRQMVQPCQNGGTAICEDPHSYAKDMKCSCAPGYTGRFCEYTTEEVVHVCNCGLSNGEVTNVPCGENALFNCRLEVNGRLCRCSTSQNHSGYSHLQKCEDIPVPLDDTVESSVSLDDIAESSTDEGDGIDEDIIDNTAFTPSTDDITL